MTPRLARASVLPIRHGQETHVRSASKSARLVMACWTRTRVPAHVVLALQALTAAPVRTPAHTVARKTRRLANVLVLVRGREPHVKRAPCSARMVGSWTLQHVLASVVAFGQVLHAALAARSAKIVAPLTPRRVTASVLPIRPGPEYIVRRVTASACMAAPSTPRHARALVQWAESS